MSRTVQECSDCGEARFLRPVDMFAGMAGPGCLLTLWLCVGCRVGLKETRYQATVTAFLHHRHSEVRQAGTAALLEKAVTS